MSVTKKQVNELENAVVVLEERIEKMEDEHKLLKQMLTMQSTLIDNLQMMMKMMSNSAQTIQQLGGDEKVEVEDHQNDKADKQLTSPSINKMKLRMSRVS
jgi:wobble nucleotide-excising tRNase